MLARFVIRGSDPKDFACKSGLWLASDAGKTGYTAGDETFRSAESRTLCASRNLARFVLRGTDPKSFACKSGLWLASDAGKIGYGAGDETFRVCRLQNCKQSVTIFC
jgi:hypothetical protein